MSKDISKQLKDLREELLQERKAFRDTLERDIRGDIRQLRTDIKEAKESMDFMNHEFESIKGNIKKVLEDNIELKKENAKLSQRCDEMERQLKNCQERLTEAEQYSRNANLEIKGVVKRDDEGLLDLMGKMGEIIGEPIVQADIAACHRVPTRDAGKSNIVLQFVNRAKRDAVLDKAKKKRLSNSDIGLDTNAPVFVNEHLCPTLKRVLGKSIEKKRQCNWKYVWVRNGRIFARQTESSPLVQIINEDDVEKIR